MKQAILEILMLAKFTKRKDLLINLCANGYLVTDRVMRVTVASMIVDDHLCIQSSEKGYSIIDGEESYLAALAYLDAKDEAIAVRRNCIVRNYAEAKLNPQLNLF